MVSPLANQSNEPNSGRELFTAQAQSEVITRRVPREKPFQSLQDIRSRRVAVQRQSLLGVRRLAKESALNPIRTSPERCLVLPDRFIHCAVNLEQAPQMIRPFERVHDRVCKLRRNASLALDFTPQLDERGIVVGQAR